MARIHHAHLYGTREHKYKILSENTLKTTDFQELNPQSPFYLFIPQNTDLLGEYDQYFKITEIMPINSVGIVTARDKLTIQDTPEAIWETINDLAKLDTETAREKYNLGKDSQDWKVKSAQEDIKKNEINQDKITPILYRPFDVRFTYYTGNSGGFICRPRPEVMKNMLLGENMGLIARRQMIGDKISYFFASQYIISDGAIRSDNKGSESLFPLYIYPDTNKPQELQEEKRANFSQEFLQKIEAKLGYLPTPESIFYYIYAVFHSPTYRSRYAEFLKIDFPRVPLTSNNELFTKLSEIGEKLVQLHLMTSPIFEPPLTPPCEGGGLEIEKAPLSKGGWGVLEFISKGDHKVAAGHPKYSKNSVIINKQGDCFKGVSEEVWNFYIGGYQVCHKWLKDRKERTLSEEDIFHYQKIVIAISETIKLMQLINGTIPSFPLE